jgi:signal transduction histidine kinase
MNLFIIITLLFFPPVTFATVLGIEPSDGSVPLLAVFITLVILFVVNVFRGRRAIQWKQYEVLQFASQPIFITKNNGDITYINEAAIKLVVFSLEEAKSKTIFDFIDGLPECLLNNISCQNIKNKEGCQCCSQLSSQIKDFKVNTQNGKSIPVSVSALQQSNGSFVYYLTELSIQKQLEKQLESQNKAATMGEFLAGVLHEIGNPMAAIEGISEALIWQAENDEQFSVENMKSQLNIIQTQAQRVNQVKNEFSLINGKSNDNVAERQSIDVNGLLKQLVDLANFDKRSNNISINLTVVAALPAIISHEGKLTQILLNLLSNAMDVLQKQNDACISISVVADGSYLKITIEDNGPGIEASLLDKIFEPFYTTKNNGTGLGLSISWRLAESLDIKFEIFSEMGQGTRVQLSIPTETGVA